MRHVAILVLVCCCLGCSDSGDIAGAAIAIDGASIRVDLYRTGGVVGEIASVSLPFTQAYASQRVANVVIDLDGDGTIADYSVGGPIQEEWVVRDLPVVIGDTELAMFFRLVDVAVATAGTARARIVLSDVDLQAAPQLGAAGMDSFEGDVTVFVSDYVDQAMPAAGAYGGGTGPNSQHHWTTETAGTDRDVDTTFLLADGSAFYRPGLPDVPQGVNTCVLHTIAGSISWLARAKGFEGKVDDEANGVDVATAEGVNELTLQLDEVGGMNYSPAAGVAEAAIVPGKNKFVADKNLPIETLRIAPTDGDTRFGPASNLFGVIQAAMKDCCTVELAMSFGGGLGHFVGVAGYSDLRFPDGGTSTTITVHDSNTSTYNDQYKLKDGKLQAFPFMGQLREGTIDFVLIECYKPALIPAPECVDEDGNLPIPCLVIDGLHYPLYQFHLGNSPDDVCEEPHWHRPVGSVFPIDPPPLDDGELTDPDINECGFGLEEEVPQEVVPVPLQQFQDFLSDHPPPD